MIPRLPNSSIEQAINRRLPLNTLCATPTTLLSGLRVADYVGDHRIRQSRYGEHDLISASAQVFFEEDGVFLAHYDGSAHGREYSAALFATFLVIEFNAFSADAHFLVLVPALEDQDGARYLGLWAAQRMERLQLALNEPGAEEQMFEDIDRLLAALTNASTAAKPTTGPKRRGWLARLLGHV